MTIASTSTIDSFLSSTRYRLWSQQILALLLRGLWWASAIALCGGFVHVFFYPLAWALFVMLVLVPVGATLLWGLIFHRPSLQTAAATADHWFSGKSLMSTALDQLSRPGVQLTRAGQFVIEQAGETASTWQKRLASEHRLRIPRQMVVPLSLTMTGCFLLILPQQASHEPEPKQLTAKDSVTPVTQKLPSTNLIADLQRALHTSTAEKHSRKADDHAGQNATPTQTALNRKKSPAQGLVPGDKAQFVAVPTPGDNRQATTESIDPAPPDTGQAAFPTRPGKKKSIAPGTLANPMANPKTAPRATQLEIEFFNMPVRQAMDSEPGTGKGKNLELKLIETKAGLSPAAQSVAAADRGISMPYEMTLSPAQKRYMARYFKSFGETP